MVPAGENEGLADEAGVSVVTKLVLAAGMPRPSRFTGLHSDTHLHTAFLIQCHQSIALRLHLLSNFDDGNRSEENGAGDATAVASHQCVSALRNI